MCVITPCVVRVAINSCFYWLVCDLIIEEKYSSDKNKSYLDSVVYRTVLWSIELTQLMENVSTYF